MAITKEQQSLLDKYDLYGYHSGGGCMHFAYDTNHEDIQWLINGVDLLQDWENKSYYDPDQTYPTDKDQLCMFGLDFNGLYTVDEVFIKDCISKFEETLSVEDVKEVYKDNWSLFFIDTLAEGVTKMKAITESINQLTRELA